MGGWQRHGWSSLAALSAFVVLSVISGTLGITFLCALGAIGLACTVLYLRYRRKARNQPVMPVTPSRDDRVIPQTVKILVAARDKGECQIKGPPCVGVGEDFDHVIPWSKGGSSKDPDNIQLACHPCNLWKSDRVLV